LLLAAFNPSDQICTANLEDNFARTPSPAPVAAAAPLSTWQGCATSNENLLEGDRLAAQGRFNEAHIRFQAGLAEEQAGTPAGLRGSACAMDRVASNLRRLGRYAVSESWAVRAVELSRSLPEKGTTAVMANNLAGLYVELGQFDKAESWATEALQLATKAFGPDHAETQLMWTTIASIYAYRGDHARAEPLLRRALFYLEKQYGSDHAEVALATVNLAEIYLAQRLPWQAIRMYLKALAIFESRPRVAQQQILLAWSGLMLSYSEAGQTTEARAFVVRTLQCAETLLPHNDPNFAVILRRAALVRSAEHDHAPARRLIERSLSILETLYGAESVALLESLRTYEHILRAAKEDKTAKLVSTRIRQITKTSAK